jgi:putative glycosyltransferase (TIGR04348 family)
VTPALLSSTSGNAVTAQRYASFFRSARWKAFLAGDYRGENVDVLVALHARKSAAAVLAFRRQHPDRAIVVVLTGTDLYRDLPRSAAARRALSAATAVVTLQPLGLQRIPQRIRRKGRSIVQSAPAFTQPSRRRKKEKADLRVCVIGHLRAEKDPFRAARAAKSLPKGMKVCVDQAGRALAPRYAAAARREMRRNARYRWRGELSAYAARRLLCSSDAMVISSIMEGGANVVCEAIACGVPIFASHIPGNIGILGARYPGFYPVRDTKALAKLMRRALEHPNFLRRLRRWISRLRPLVNPVRERRAWIGLISALVAKWSGKQPHKTPQP